MLPGEAVQGRVPSQWVGGAGLGLIPNALRTMSNYSMLGVTVSRLWSQRG